MNRAQEPGIKKAALRPFDVNRVARYSLFVKGMRLSGPQRPAGGISQASTVLLNQLTTVDASRVRGLVGAPTAGEFVPIAAGLRAPIEG